jgi:hypothetical protein
MKAPREPRMTNAVALGIEALSKPGVVTALVDGTSHPNAGADVGPDDVRNAEKALAFAAAWKAWHVADLKRKAKWMRARARALLAGVSS